MATQAALHEQQAAIGGLVQAWERRWRARQTLLWLPRSFIPGLLLGIVLLVVSRLRPWLLNEQILIITAGAVLGAAGAMALITWLWPRPTLESARRFDMLFDLGERTSTAIELIEGRIRTNEELKALQLGDAWEKARVVRAADHLPMRWERRWWIIVAALLGLWLVLFVLPNPQVEAINQNSAREVAVAEAAEELKRITQEVAADTSLSEEERSQLLQELRRSTETLTEPERQPEEALAALSAAESELREQAEQLGEMAEAQRAALEQTAQALRNLQATRESNQAAEAAAQGNPIPTLAQLQEAVNSMSQAERMEAAAALEQAADALQETNPQAAQALREAAEALRRGDTQAAQEALQRAAESMQAQQQQAQQQQNSAQNLNQSAQNLQQAQQQIGQRQGQQQQGGSENLQQLQRLNQNSGQQQQQQPSGQQPGQSDTPGQQAGESGQQGSTPGDSGQQPGSQEGGQPSSMQQQGQPGSQSQQTSQAAAGGGAGDAPGDAGSDQTQSGSQLGAQQDNNPDGSGEGRMPLVYAPQRIGGQSDQQMFLEPDSSDVPVVEGEFSQNPAGQALVPYNQVYSDYRNSANRALESDYIPLGLRDVVRNYFTSLEPGQTRAER